MAQYAHPIASQPVFSYWGILFPDELDPLVSLKSRFRVKALQYLAADRETAPVCLETLEVSKQGAKLTVGVHDVELTPWFSMAWPGEAPQWNPGHEDYYNPFEKLAGAESPDHVKCWLKQAKEMARCIAYSIGEDLRRELEFKIRIGHLSASGRREEDGARFEDVEIVELLNKGLSIDIPNNRIASRIELVHISNLHFKSGPYFFADAKKPKRLQEYVPALLERMQVLLRDGAADDVRDAARKVAHLAISRGRQIESVVKRLEKAYSARTKARLAAASQSVLLRYAA